MIRSNLCHSAIKARRMKDRKKTLKAARASLKDGIYLFVCLLVAVNLFSRIEIKIQPKGVAEVKAVEKVETVIKEVITEVPDERISKLQTFLESKHSPMAPYSKLIIEEADKNDIGWTWITGISCMESACGLKLPYNSYNAWGLGGSNFMYFKSWEESIKYMSELLGTSYRHNMLQGIKQKYCPASDGCNPAWAAVVAKASKEINGI